VNIYRWTCPKGHYEGVATDLNGTPGHIGWCPHMQENGEFCAARLIMTVTYGEEARCGHEWPLEDPNEEDAALLRSHCCRLLSTDHAARHICGCGAYIDVGGSE